MSTVYSTSALQALSNLQLRGLLCKARYDPGSAVDDALGDPPEVLDKYDALGGRHRPQFANAQWLHFLHAGSGAAPPGRKTVGMGHVRPRLAEHARIRLANSTIAR